MSIQVQKRLYNVAELLEVNSQSETQYELMNGELIALTLNTFKEGNLAAKIGAKILTYVEQYNRGEVVNGTGYILKHDPDIVCGPVVSYFSGAKLALAEKADEEGYLDFAPDLAVEVISPGDRAGEVFQKVQKYLAAGVPLIWLVYPKKEIVNVIRPDEPILMLSRKNGGKLEGYDVLPDFELPLENLFARTAGQSSQEG